MTFLTMIISAIREIVNPKVTQIAKCGSLASTVIDSARRLGSYEFFLTTDRQLVRSNR